MTCAYMDCDRTASTWVHVPIVDDHIDRVPFCDLHAFLFDEDEKFLTEWIQEESEAR